MPRTAPLESASGPAATCSKADPRIAPPRSARAPVNGESATAGQPATRPFRRRHEFRAQAAVHSLAVSRTRADSGVKKRSPTFDAWPVGLEDSGLRRRPDQPPSRSGLSQYESQGANGPDTKRVSAISAAGPRALDRPSGQADVPPDLDVDLTVDAAGVVAAIRKERPQRTSAVGTRRVAIDQSQDCRWDAKMRISACDSAAVVTTPRVRCPARLPSRWRSLMRPRP
jgi:hypothetical protein